MSILINSAKELAQGYKPLHLFDFTWPDGQSLSVCEIAVTFNSVAYGARVIAQQIDQIQALSPTGIDIPPSVKITLADADKSLWSIEAAKKFRGARLKVTFVFYDFLTGTFSDAIVPFVGRCGRPEINDETLAVSASYILNLQAVNLPQRPVQVQCPNIIPANAAQKALADTPGSLYYACGVTDPTKTTCTYDKAGCAINANSPRFSGIVYEVPPASKSREYTTGNWLTTLVSDPNDTKYGDFVPLGFGTGWVDCLSLGTFPDANSTRGEAIVCEGAIKNIVQVVVADEILPAATDITGALNYSVADPLFRYNVISQGGRDGRLNTDKPWNGTGDPHGSMCVIEWVVPHSVTSGTPSISALVMFPDVEAYAKIATIVGGVATLPAGVANAKIFGNPPYTVTIIGNSNPALNGTWGLTSATYGPPGTFTLTGTTASGTGGYVIYPISSSDYAWTIFNVLKRAGAQAADIDIDSFIAASNYYAQLVPYTTTQNKNYSSDVTYADGDVVLYGGQYYISLQDGNLNQSVVSFGSDWWASTANPPTATVTNSQHARYTCSLVLRQRRTAADVVTGLLRGCNSHLGRNLTTGQISLVFRGTIAQQQPTLPDGSNYSSAVAGGYVAYSFDEASMARVGTGANKKSSFQRAARSGPGIPNVVTVGFSNEENDWSGDSSKVTDPDDIALMGQEIVGSLTTDGCNALDRANRIGSIYLSEQLGGDVWEWITSAKFVKGLAGQIVLVSNVKYGFSLQPFRVLAIAPEANYRAARITAAIHDDAWYADDLTSVGAPSGSKRNQLARPSWPWCPNSVHAPSGDALFTVDEYTFGLALNYASNFADGTPQPVASITGVIPVNNPDASLLPPVLRAQGNTASSGGSLPGDGTVIFIAAASTNAAGLPGPVSSPCQIAIAQSGSTNTATAPALFWDPNGSGWIIYAGLSSAKLTRQSSGTGTPPAAIVLTSLVGPGEGQPDTEYDEMTVEPRWVPHVGPWANTVTVGTGTLKITGAGWSTNQWQNYDCMLLWKADGSPLPIADFHVTSNTADTLSVTPDPVALGLVTGDLIGMLSLPTVSGKTLTDANWMNSLSNSGLGLAVHGERGRWIRFIKGPGRGYRYPVDDNTATAITIQGDWIVVPNSTSRYVVEDTMPIPGLDSGSQTNGDPAATMNLAVPVANFGGEVLSFEVITQDGGGNQSAAQLNPVRLMYVAGSGGARIITNDATMLPTDGKVRAVISLGHTYTCLPFSQVPGQRFVIQNDSTSGGNLSIALATGAGDKWSDGTTPPTIVPPGQSSEFVVGA